MRSLITRTRAPPCQVAHVFPFNDADCLVYTRGTKSDIDTWATLSGEESWGWDGVLPYFKKVRHRTNRLPGKDSQISFQSEKFNLPVDGHNVSDQFTPEVHGFDGIIGVSVPGAARATDDRIIAVTQELDEFPYRVDMNSGEHLGVGGYCG